MKIEFRLRKGPLGIFLLGLTLMAIVGVDLCGGVHLLSAGSRAERVEWEDRERSEWPMRSWCTKIESTAGDRSPTSRGKRAK